MKKADRERRVVTRCVVHATNKTKQRALTCKRHGHEEENNSKHKSKTKTSQLQQPPRLHGGGSYSFLRLHGGESEGIQLAVHAKQGHLCFGVQPQVKLPLHTLHVFGGKHGGNRGLVQQAA